MNQTNRHPPTVQVDGDTIRRLRETKALTQLYVAEVVGVSVDTVSRWENNRTQNVRRDNAEALAAALEVSLDEVLRGPDPATDESPEAPERAPRWMRRRATWVGVFCLGLAALGFAAWRHTSTAPLVVEAVRRLPPYAPPSTDVPVVVTIRVVSGEGRRVILREIIPQGWRFVGAVAGPDQGPTPEGVVKWILPIDNGEMRLTYLLHTPDDGEEGTAFRLRGEVVTPGRKAKTVPVRGATRIDLEYIHWADEDADFQIGDSEVLDALERLEGAPGLGLDPTDLRRLWGASEYSWDKSLKSFRPHDR